MSIAIVLHTDTDAGICQNLCKRNLLQGMPVELIFIPPGQRYADKDGEYDRIFHLDTGGIYNPATGDFDHHGIPKGHPKHGKCSALLMMEHIDEQLYKPRNISPPPEDWTLAWFAQSIDKEKDKTRSDEFQPSKQDPGSTQILYTLPKSIAQLRRTKRSDEEIIAYIDMTIDSYLGQRKEPEIFLKWFHNSLAAGKTKIATKTDFGVSALLADEIPYDSGDFRSLITHHLKAFPFIIGHYLPTHRRPYHRFGVNNLNMKLCPKIKLEKVARVLCEKFPRLCDDKNALFLHNDKFCLYLNDIPEGFTFEEFVKIVLKS